jgi:hypothetical protein
MPRPCKPGRPEGLRYTQLWLTLGLGLAAAAAPLAQQPRHFPLDTPGGVAAHGVVVTPDTLQGKPGLKVVASPEAMRQDAAETLATLDGVEFGNGTIEAEIAGAPAPDAPEGARGFVGIAFRVQADLRTYDAFYLRPTNGRADDQERRNHAAQYISHPEWPWFRLRKETPSKYESYVDVQPDVWTKIRIEVRGDHARLFVHDQQQPTLVVNDVKTGANAKGGVALWIDRGTVAHFRDLTVQ